MNWCLMEAVQWVAAEEEESEQASGARERGW